MATNNSLLDTNLNISPYFDDYDPTKQYYKILFKPRTAVQVRELNQLQTILQNQIASFGQNIFKEGSVIKGCAFTFDNKYSYVKLSDTYANTTALTVSDLNGLVVYNTRGLKAIVVNTVDGLASQAPDYNTIYVKYLNSALYSNGSTQTSFDANEQLAFYTEANTYQGNVVVANTANPSGYGYAFTTTEGVIFKKGYFIYVTPQTIIVKKYDNIPDGLSVGFEAEESIVTANSDETLFDNAAGAPNYTAPGADRLKLEPVLVTRATNIANTTTFFSLVDFKAGQPITIRNDAQFNSIETELARRSYETNGNFVVNPFIITTSPIANTSDPYRANSFNTIVSSGLGYVEGHRVQFINNNTTRSRRGTDTDILEQQQVSLNFGYYIVANELSGEFGDSNAIVQVELHNVAKTSITSKTFLSSGYSASEKIGTAYLRGISYQSGSQGAPDAQYRLYLFNIAMNPGSNFADVKSIFYRDAGVTEGVTDILLSYNITSNNYIASINNSYLNTMIYPYGQRAIKSDGFDNVQFVYRKLSNTQILANGTATVTVQIPTGLGSETFQYLGTLSSSQMNDFIVVPTANGYSANKTGTVQVYTDNTGIRGTSTTFITDYAVGDNILISSQLKRVISISNNTYLDVDSTYSSNASGLNHQKAFIKGNPIPFSTRSARSMTVASNTLTISIGETANAAFNVKVVHSLNRSSTTSIKKNINKNVYVKLDLSNNASGHIGPWSLGLPDVYKLDGVYIDYSGNKTYLNTGTNYVNNFTLDNGQRDTHYDIAKLNVLTNSISDKLTPNTTILVKLSAFTYDTSQGVGFFNANSYPIDDANTANTNAITTAQIPTYTSVAGTFYDLRDSIDFRPYATNTAVVTTTIGSATINPSSTLAFNYTPYLPAPDSIFQSDIEYYLGRIDRISLDINGNIVISEGLPSSSKSVAPLEKSGTMTLSLMTIPPYPSLTTFEAKNFNRYDFAIETQLLQNRRYTMKDIGSFDKRIKNLEYYTSLSLLEQSAATLQVRNSDTGQNRFQNGIFVDPFKGFDLSNTNDPNFYIAIDPTRNELRPAFIQMRSDFTFDQSLSSNVSQYGQLVMLNHTSNNVLIQQNYASRLRNCVEGKIYNWRGTITLTPSGSTAPDITQSADVVNNIDLAQNWITLAQSAWGTQWGNWETVSTEYANTLISASNTVSQRIGEVAPPQVYVEPPPQNQYSSQYEGDGGFTTSDYSAQD